MIITDYYVIITVSNFVKKSESIQKYVTLE